MTRFQQKIEEGLEVDPHKDSFSAIEHSLPTEKESPKTRTIIISLFAFVTLLAVALGVGLGQGLRHSGTLNRSPSNSSPPSSSPNPLLKHGAQNGTSLAVAMAGGYEHVFFQDLNGSLRHTASSTYTPSWSTSENFIATQLLVRNNTPLAVTDASESSFVLHVFFLDENGLVAVVAYSSDATVNGLRIPMNNSIKVADESQTLSFSSTNPILNNTTAEGFLLFEAANGNVSVLRGYCFRTENPPYSTWQWHDVSNNIYTPIIYSSISRSDYSTWLSTPLGSFSYVYSETNNQSLSIYFFNPEALSNKRESPLFCLEMSDWIGFRKSLHDLPLKWCYAFRLHHAKSYSVRSKLWLVIYGPNSSRQLIQPDAK